MTFSAWKAFGIGDTGALRPLGYIACTKDGVDRNGYIPDEVALAYEPGGVYTAQCKAPYANSFRKGGLMSNASSIRDWHWSLDAWGNDCECGFYMRKDRDELVSYLLKHCHPREAIGFVIGEVLPEGWVAEHKMGLRAERMRVLAPELVIMQYGVSRWRPLQQRLTFNQIYNSNWKDVRVVSWAEWKQKELPWILEKLKESSRSSLSQSRSSHLHLTQPRSPSPLNAAIPYAGYIEFGFQQRTTEEAERLMVEWKRLTEATIRASFSFKDLKGILDA